MRMEDDCSSKNRDMQELAIKIARLEEQLNSSDKALLIARSALEHNQAISNEWRKENIDQRSLFLTIEKGQSLVNVEGALRGALEARVFILEKMAQTDIGKHAAGSSIWTNTVVIVSLVIAAAGLMIGYLRR